MANRSTILDGFEEFCGGTFWNASLTWYTDQPELTPCFLSTVLVWVGPAWLWLVLPLYAIYLSKSSEPQVPTSKLYYAKLVLCLLMVVLSGIVLTISIIEYNGESESSPALIVSPAITTATLSLVCVLIYIERKQGLITSGVLFIFWLLTIISGIPLVYSLILHRVRDNDIHDLTKFIAFFIFYGISVVELVLFCFADASYLGDMVCPETRSSFLSRITYSWLNSLVITGYKKALTEDDIWTLSPRDLSGQVGSSLEKSWEQELVRCKWNCGKGESPIYRDTADFDDDERTPLLASRKDAPQSARAKAKREPSLFRTLAKVFGLTLLQAHLCKLVCDILTFIGPVLQRLLIGFTKAKDYDSQPVWHGYLYAAIFFVVPMCTSVFFQMLFHIGLTLGMRMKSAVIYLVYKKALVLSNEARSQTTVGEIVNLMSVDAQRLQDVTGYLWMVWSSPLQISIAIWLLWDLLGPSVLAGLVVMILLIPCNVLIAGRQQKLQVMQMECKDERIKLMDEVLSGIKVLKLYAWELAFGDKVTAIRDRELVRLQSYASLAAIGSFSWTLATFMVMLSTFTAYVLSGNKLEAETAFVALSLFNILYFPINLLPLMISYMVTAMVSIKRLGKFLRLDELDPECVTHSILPAPITINNASFSWGISNPATALQNISLTVPEGSLLAVIGQVGAGKSSLISAMLGEMDKIKGDVNLFGSVAYVAQQAWIQNATLRDNILFGMPYDKDKYNEVIEACALKPDLEILPGGDQTEIGEKGINLSGGQKQRVSLARAVYNNADIYLLDDPLSAVDAHVGKHIFDNVIGDNGLLGKKTRVLVTHGLHWLPRVHKVVVLEHGKISETGSCDELLEHDGPCAQLLRSQLVNRLNDGDEDEDIDPEVEAAKQALLQRLESIGDHPKSGLESDADHESTKVAATRKPSTGILKRQRSLSSPTATAEDKKKMGTQKKPSEPATGQQLVSAERAEVGRVQWSVFGAYARALGLGSTVTLILSYTLYQASSVAANLWLTQWTNDNTTLNSSDYLSTRDFYLGIYGGLGGLQAIFILLYALMLAFSMVKASRVLHHSMLYHTLRSPMSFFDTTPSGRILNRFSRDVETVDNILPELIRSWMNTFFIVLSSVVVIAYSTPIFLTVTIPLGIIYYFIQRFYIPTSRQLKRLESTSRSPVYSHFGETVNGASTIRAYRVQNDFLHKSNALVDHNLVFYFASMSSNRWLGFRLDFISACIVLAAALFAVLGRDTLSGGVVGLSISYALQATSELNWMVRVTSDLETNIVSVERIKEYTETPNEAEVQIEATKPEAGWPQEGALTFNQYSTRYRDDLDLVLNSVKFSISAGEKVGIVGRTGAGKSSLTLALFRIVEAASGNILLDGVDISRLGLHQLRSRITILPQDPVLFSGTLRFNIDPMDHSDDVSIWEAIRRANLVTFVQSLNNGLGYECGEGGRNLSVGQRQLVCLARALLHKTRVLVLDEATAAVDLETDELIQDTIRREFAECTVLSIAHRLNTIMDYDRILVLDKGQVAEFDSPHSLLSIETSKFYGMAKEAGLV